MKVLAFLVATLSALMLSGCVTTEPKTAGTDAGVVTNPRVKADAKPVAKMTPKARDTIRTYFIDI